MKGSKQFCMTSFVTPHKLNLNRNFFYQALQNRFFSDNSVFNTEECRQKFWVRSMSFKFKESHEILATAYFSPDVRFWIYQP